MEGRMVTDNLKFAFIFTDLQNFFSVSATILKKILIERVLFIFKESLSDINWVIFAIIFGWKFTGSWQEGTVSENFYRLFQWQKMTKWDATVKVILTIK